MRKEQIITTNNNQMEEKGMKSSMQGIFPTITKFGMAALLPHGVLLIERRTSRV